MSKKIINIIIIFVGLCLIFSSGKSIIYLLGRSRRIENTQGSLVNVQKENNALKKQLQKVESKEYLEKSAREKLNLVKEGETLVILPSIIPIFENEKKLKDNIPNWQKWYRLFF